MEDIRAVALLGKYYAHKIQGATNMALFRKTNDVVHQDEAIEELIQAATYWRRYASTALGQYRNPLWTNRVGHVDWRDLFNHILNDVTIAGGRPRLPSMSPTEGGSILEAEAADSDCCADPGRCPSGEDAEADNVSRRGQRIVGCDPTSNQPDCGQCF